MAHTREKAVAGVTSGLIQPDQEVQWRARHFGLWFSMRVRITSFNPPSHFRDEMVQGPFRSFQHDHVFDWQNSRTLMTDRVIFASPLSPVGKAFDKLILKAHLQRLLEGRNRFLKSIAESDQWRTYVSLPVS